MMESQANFKYLISSNCIFGVLGIMIVTYFITLMSPEMASNPWSLIAVNALLIAIIAVMVRVEKKWVKILPAILLILYLIEAFYVTALPEVNTVEKTSFLMQIILLTWATLILYIDFKLKTNESA